jgi:hypothetical protein
MYARKLVMKATDKEPKAQLINGPSLDRKTIVVLEMMKNNCAKFSHMYHLGLKA